MKNVLIFIAGMITGAVLLYIVATAASSAETGIEFFDQPGECVTSYPLKVVQVLDAGAIAIIDEGYQYGSAVFITNNKGQHFYDRQIINIPEGTCARHIGIYKYYNTDEMLKTIPIVEIMKYKW